MNRRNFLKFLGSAVAGATVAYSFPSIIVPKNIQTIAEVNGFTEAVNDGPKLTFEMLEKVYRDCCIGSVEPDIIWTNESTYNYIIERLIPPNNRLITEKNGIKFHVVEIRKEPKLFGGSLDIDELHVSGELYGNCGRFKF